MNVAPGADYSSRLSLGPVDTGLVGTVRFRLIDNDPEVDDPVFGPTTAGIIEDPSDSGVYLFLGTAPVTSGVFVPVWDKGPDTEVYLDENLIVSGELFLPPVPSGHDYITLSQLKATLEMNGLSFADVDMAVSITSASRAVDDYCHRRFYQDTSSNTRSYFPRGNYSRILTADIVTIDSVEVDGVTLDEGTDYVPLPVNAPLDNRPYEEIQLLSILPTIGQPSVTVTGVFGWSEVPLAVVAATTIVATRLLRRQREAPFGIVSIGIEQGAVARIAPKDPDLEKVLCNYVKYPAQVMIA